MSRAFELLTKVVPVSKTPRIRDRDNCGTFYRQQETGQEYLYVTGIDLEEEARLSVPCYWCNVSPHLGGDSFTEKDLIRYGGEQ